MYDGGFTDARVESATSSYKAKKYQSDSKLEDLIYETIEAYLELSKTQELLNLNQIKLGVHEETLKIERINEQENDTQLDRAKIEAKTELAYTRYLDLKKDFYRAKSKLQQLMNTDDDKLSLCRPNIISDVVPKKIDSGLDYLIVNNLLVKEQIAKIKDQQAQIYEQQSRLLPKITFEATGSRDNNITSNGITTSYDAKIVLRYNLFNGEKDSAMIQREKIFYAQSQKTLDQITHDQINKFKQAYHTYFNTIEKLDRLDRYKKVSEEIVQINLDQFTGGTSTNLDILNAKNEVLQAHIDTISEQYNQYSSYFQTMLTLSKLSDTVFAQNNYQCKEYKLTLEDVLPMKAQVIEDEDELELQESDLDLNVVDEVSTKKLTEKKPLKEELPINKNEINKSNSDYSKWITDIYENKNDKHEQ